MYQNHHVTQEGRILFLDKMSSKQMYFTLISNTVNARISNTYFKILFTNTTLDLSKIYLLSRVAVIDTTLGFLQHNILNNVLFLNKKQCTFGITNTALFSFCNTLAEILSMFSMIPFVLSPFEKILDETSE